MKSHTVDHIYMLGSIEYDMNVTVTIRTDSTKFSRLITFRYEFLMYHVNRSDQENWTVNEEALAFSN